MSRPTLTTDADLPVPGEIYARQIPLAGDIRRDDSEISGLAWYGQRLILLPQFPARFGTTEIGRIFTIEQAVIADSLASENPEPITPGAMLIDLGNINALVPGFEGFEAIAFYGDQASLTIEAEVEAQTTTHIVSGTVVGNVLALDTATLQTIPNQTRVDNLGYEAIIRTETSATVFHEYNGVGNLDRHATKFDVLSLGNSENIPMPELSYRLTDATGLDDANRFWVTNYFWEGDVWEPGVCVLRERYGDGESHSQSRRVERMVELEIGAEGIGIVDRAPLQLHLSPGSGRNWEGIARMGNRGLLLVTDEHPETILAFAAFPGSESSGGVSLAASP